jgi:cytoskeleton protein RodZ
MPSIGETLREARMRQRLDIADVETRTKIRAKYLRALENEEFGMLPGSTFVKTFLRTYAEVLGLDPHVLVEEYRANFEPQDEGEIQPALGTPAAGGRERERRYPAGPPGRSTVAIAAVVLVLALLLVLGLTGDDEDGGQRAANGRTETAQRERPAREKRRGTPERKPASTTVTLKVAPTVPTYVCLDSGPGTEITFEGILAEARTFKGRKLRINLGKTSVEMSANGKPVPIEQSPNPVGFEFSSSGNKPLPTGDRPCAQA